MGLTPAGLPVGVQVAARHGADHLSIAIALELEAVFGGWVPPRAACPVLKPNEDPDWVPVQRFLSTVPTAGLGAAPRNSIPTA